MTLSPARATTDDAGLPTDLLGAEAEDEDVLLFPASFSQQRIWLLDQLEPHSPTYNMSAAVRLRGTPDVGALERSINEIVRRHEVLRTTFPSIDGRPVQLVAPELTIPLELVDLRHLPADRADEAARAIAAEHAGQPLDIARGPLLRTHLIRLGDTDHLLVSTVHHIVFDGWSSGVFIRELAALYEAFTLGRPSPLPEPALQYADFTVWQQAWLDGPLLDRQLSYWRQQLAGSPPFLALPTDRPRPAVQSFRGGHEAHRLSPGLSGRLKALARREGATDFMVLLAAFTVVLQRLSGQDDVTVGTPIAGRTRPETEGMIGLFLNTLALRIDLSGAPTFRELVRRVREVALGAYAHQDVPFELVLNALQPVRDPGRTPLFQVMFNMLSFDRVTLALPGLDVELSLPADVNAKFDLTVYVGEQEGTFALHLVYNADLFDSERILELRRQFQRILEQIVDRPDHPIADLSLVTSVSAQKLPDPRQPLSRTSSESVLARFARQARRLPDQPAVIDGRAIWTYGDLDRLSRGLAARLVASGVRPGDVVAIYGHRSASLVLALLGVVKAGGAFALLDSRYPAARLIACLDAAQPRAWLRLDTAGRPDSVLENELQRRVDLPMLTVPADPRSAERTLLSEHLDWTPPAETRPDDLAYLAFTSGTTGRPKAILGPAAPLAHFLEWYTETFDLDEGDRFALLAGLAHDPLLRDVFTPLWLGATLYVPDPDEMLQPTWLAHWLDQHRISVVHLTPALSQLLAGSGSSRAPVTIPSLRYAFFGGDVLRQADLTRLARAAPSATCVNFYGATETPQAIAFAVASDPGNRGANNRGDERSIVPIGRGIRDVQLLVLNAADQLAGVGELGEICVRTPYLAHGYKDDPALTDARFACNPFATDTADRIYRTGDLGRYLSNGQVELVGRADAQVKIRGFRVEPSEVEAVLRQHPDVQAAAVVASPDPSGGQRLIGYVVAMAGTALDLDEPWRFLAQRLPEYMVPARLVLVDHLPLTPNGKLDRRALPAPELKVLSRDAAQAAPRTPSEERLAAIWAEVLTLDRVGAHDSFFELGGHSLLAAQVVARVSDSFGIDLPLRAIFTTPILADQAALIEEILIAEIAQMDERDAERLTASDITPDEEHAR